MDSSRFNTLWQRAGARNNSTAAFAVLVDYYSEPHRRYHTARHVRDCLEIYDSAVPVLGNNDAVEMALWFHDAVYIVGQTDNESCSAALFRSLSEGYLPSDFNEQVVRLIMATRHNQAPTAADEQFATDVDLDGLAKPWDAFITDTQLLRQENSATDDKTFRGNVRGFFERLLARPSIYATGHFEVKSEAIARGNIERLLAELDSLPLGP